MSTLQDEEREIPMLPIAAEIATRLTREQAQSARPDAPVIPDEDVTPRRSRLASLVTGLRLPRWTPGGAAARLERRAG